MVTVQGALLKQWDKLVDTIQVNEELISILKTNRILSLPDFVHLCNCKALIGNTDTAHELLRILGLRLELSLSDVEKIFSLAKQPEVVKLLTDSQDEPQTKTGRRRKSLIICCGREKPRRPYYDDYYYSRRSLAASTMLASAHYNHTAVNTGPDVDDLKQVQNKSFPLPHINARYYYDRHHVIGTGRTSQVFLGYRDNDPELKVAVKWVYKNHCTVSPAELDIGKQIWREMGSPTCTNVVPVYDWSMDENAYFIVMELATGNLYDAIYNEAEWNEDGSKKPVKILENCVKGLQWLHNHGIIHNELRPENILLFRYEDEKEVRVVAKVGDFGISRRIEKIPGLGFTLPSLMWNSGVESWMSPELKAALDAGDPFVGTLEMDIYSLGAVYQFCLKEETNAKPPSPISENLLKWMMNNEPDLRPTISQVREHPVFWDEEKCLIFLGDISRCLSDKKCEGCLVVRKEINDGYKNYHRILFGEELNWKPYLEDLNLFEKTPNKRSKKYETELILSLVELIRDKAEHYQEMKSEVKVVLFDNSSYNRKHYVQYFLDRFPYIVINLFCELASIVNYRDCLATLKEQYFMSFLDMDHRDCWRDDENIFTLLNA